MQILMNACLIHVQLTEIVKTLMEVLLVLVKMVILELEYYVMVIKTYVVLFRVFFNINLLCLILNGLKQK